MNHALFSYPRELDDFTSLQLRLLQIVCAEVSSPVVDVEKRTCVAGSKYAPKVHFMLLGTSDVKRYTPVFFEMDTPDGRIFAVTDRGKEVAVVTDRDIEFFYTPDSGDGDYVVTSAYVIVNGWGHYIVAGNAFPEPLYGAVLMGLPPKPFIGAVVLISMVQAALLFVYFRQERTCPDLPPGEGAPPDACAKEN